MSTSGARVPPPSLPDIFLYLDHRAFLREWFDARKAANPRFSHRAFARLARQASPSLLLQVTQGRRNLTEATATAFAKAMRMDGEEAAFFWLLVQFDAADTHDERNRVWAELSATRRFRQARRLAGESVAYLSNWYLPAIREMAGCPGFQMDPAWVSRRLRPRISPAEAQQALHTLIDLGMIALDERGKAVQRESTVATPPEVAGLAAHNYHRQMLSRAAESIESARPEERYLGGVTVTIPSTLLPQLKRELISFQSRVLDLCDSAEHPHELVYQFNLQLFPLSSPPESP
jgi:uncharacterized protein (TIGR02147 family)